MNHDDYFFLGTIQRTYQLQGALVAFFDVDDLTKYKKLDWIFIEDGAALVPYEIERIKIHAKSFILKLKNVDTLDKAEMLIQKNLFLPIDKLPKLKANQFYFHEVIGYNVNDEKEGELGKIEELQEYPGQTLAKITYKEKEVLLPLLLKWITKVDKENKTLTYLLPEGYLDVYTTDNKQK